MIKVITCKDIDNKGSDEKTASLLNEIAELIRIDFNKDSKKSHGLISNYKALKESIDLEGESHHTDLEKLFEAIKNKKDVAKDKLNDIVNYISLKYMVPIHIKGKVSENTKDCRIYVDLAALKNAEDILADLVENLKNFVGGKITIGDR